MKLKEKVEVLSSVGDIATWVIYAGGGIWWSEELYQLYGMNRGEGITIDAFEKRVYSEDFKRLKSVLEIATKEKESFSVEVRVQIGPSFQWVHIKGRALDNGDIYGITQNIDSFFRGYAELLQNMKVIKALSANPEGSVSKIHSLLYD